MASNLGLYYMERSASARPSSPKLLPAAGGKAMRGPEAYLPDAGLVDAVNAAIILRQPLLLTGEAGTGKTQLAYSVAWQLGLEPPFVFEVKSNSISRDLFYTFDTLARLHAAQAGDRSIDPRAFLTLNALGSAIAHANPDGNMPALLGTGDIGGEARQSVVLIDEIDKAPREFPNDLLNELERMFFRVPELGGMTVTAPEAFQPIIIVTSNLERNLSDAFLRRCVYYNIPFPSQDRLTDIVFARLGNGVEAGSQLIADCIDFALYIRSEEAGLQKRPGTAELLNWIYLLLRAGGDPATKLSRQSTLVGRTLGTLGKLADDQNRIRSLFSAWAQNRDR